ncbi:MAG: hypothetical protein NXI27_21205 [Alphaproteobacteria bacterium]|nr:hypothetical protein [Alphaproteobacteria bacterium]
MSYFLYKPHVIGPEESITTPDIMVDRVFENGRLRSVNSVSSDCWRQVETVETGVSAQAAYAVVALGGGALIGPAVVVSDGAIIIARKAWRLNNLDGHIADVTLNGTKLSDLDLPAAIIEKAGGSGDTLPRGYMLLCTAPGDVRDAVLSDPIRQRSLSHRIVLDPVDHDRWGTARPKPRYSVGPTQKDVQHFI